MRNLRKLPLFDMANVTSIDPNAIQSQLIQLPGISCTLKDGQPVGDSCTAFWTNNTGMQCNVFAGWVWVGADSAGIPVNLPSGWQDLASFISHSYLGGEADISYLLQTSQGGILAWNNWDHYANPTSINSDVERFVYPPPYYFPVANGEIVTLSLSCAGPYIGTTVSANGMAVIQYVRVPNG